MTMLNKEVWKWTKSLKYQWITRRDHKELFDGLAEEIKANGVRRTFPGDEEYPAGSHKVYEKDGWVYWRFRMLMDRQPKRMFEAAIVGITFPLEK
jgi:hypothetical protein